MGIEDILLFDETIFKNIDAFNPDYVPDNYLHRENQMESLAICLRPALKGGRPINTVVLGSPATGKTTAINKIFNMVESNSDKVVCVYVNCQLHTTRFNIFSQIYNKIFGHMPPETGVPFSRIYGSIMKHLQKEKKSMVVALDDVSYLFHSKNANKIFYDILRAHEEFKGVKTGIFAILSDIEFRYMLDKNVTSVFIPQEVVFDPYSTPEMFDILKDRVRAGFYPDVISDELLNTIAEQASEVGDLRMGIDLLRVSGNFAEADASKTIEEKHLKQALSNTSSTNLRSTLKTLSNEDKLLLKAIAEYETDDLIAGDLYKLFNNAHPTSYASFDRKLNKLEFLRMIDTKFTGKGVKGNSRLIILRFDSEDILKCLERID
ncbi:Cell division control protein 6-like protein [Methanobacterium lacus]|jgi:archaeal cell division control protein 6|uniref:ORC1-type DNA replication protein n=1 Tax=Methanobacterium lacus (strain AL-21) TaxID=877455 RepID=F0T9Z0_METLA|nr:ORC1-type DNA replication protein [Methanobacterium lacus]ADZ08813.1 Cell division control protein 6-like protein [Methanobacterium lacus]